MKRLKLFLVIVVFMGFVGLAHTADYSTALATYTITSDTTNFAASYPNITGTIAIDQLVFVTTNTQATPILITFYDNATSTTAAAVNGESGYYVLVASMAVNGTGECRAIYNYPMENQLVITSPAFFLKSVNSATDKVYMQINYRKK